MKEINLLEERTTRLRKKMDALAQSGIAHTDERVLAVSRELDACIAAYYVLSSQVADSIAPK